jgi:LysR family transcriptional regulator, cyn operon transcriptional activator
MELRLLEYFLAICNEMQYTKAAEKLGISQPTLSQQMRILESRVGSKLFQQIGKKIYLTDSGKILRNRALKIFNEIEQTQREIDEVNNLQRGKLKICCSGNYLIHPSILAFQKKYPYIEISLTDLPSKDSIDNILDSTYDLGIVFLPVHDNRLESHFLFKSELFLICAQNHVLAKASSIKLRELEDYRLFLLDRSFLIRRIIDQFCLESDINLKPNIELSDIFSLLKITFNGNGVTILPKHLVKHYVTYQKISIIPILDPLPIKELGVVYPKTGFVSVASKAFIDILLEDYGYNRV